MSATLQTVLTVVEIVALVLVLAAFLVLLERQLRSVATALAEASVGVKALERRFAELESAGTTANWRLEEIAGELPEIARKLEGAGGTR